MAKVLGSLVAKEHPGLISFRMDCLDLLTVQGTLKSLLQHHSSKASILQHSAFFTVQLSHPYMTTGKTIALTRRTLVGKVMSLLLNCAMEMTNRFKGLELIDTVPEELWTKVGDIVQEAVIKTIPKEKQCKRPKGCLRRPYK